MIDKQQPDTTMDGAHDLALVTSAAGLSGRAQSEQDRVHALQMELNEEMARARRLIGEIDRILGRNNASVVSVSQSAS
jgi:hypothetical protein